MSFRRPSGWHTKLGETEVKAIQTIVREDLADCCVFYAWSAFNNDHALFRMVSLPGPNQESPQLQSTQLTPTQAIWPRRRSAQLLSWVPASAFLNIIDEV